MCNTSQDCLFEDDFGEKVGVGLCVEKNCQCSILIGFTGEFCNESSPQVVAHVLTRVFGVIVFSTLFLLALKLLMNLYKLKTNVSQSNETIEKQGKTKKLLYFVLLGVSLAILGTIIHMLLYLWALGDGARFTVTEADGKEYVTVAAEDFLSIVLTLSFTFFLFSLLMICLSWISLLEDLSEFSSRESDLRIFRVVGRVLTYVLVIGGIMLPLLTILGQRDSIDLIIGLLVILLIILTFSTSYYLSKTLKSLHAKLTKQTVQLISRFSRIVGISLLIVFANSIIFSIEVRARSSEEIDSVDANATLVLLLYNMVLTFCFGVILWYCYSVLRNLLSSQQTSNQLNASGSTSNLMGKHGKV